MATKPRQSTAAQLSRRAQRRAKQERAARRRRQLLIGGVVVVAVLAAVVLIYLNRPKAEQATAPVQPATGHFTGIPQNGRVLGNPNAPVLLVEWGDYQCPACKNFEDLVLPQLINDYIRPGKVRLEFRDFAFIGQESQTAAEAAFCALDQGKFWDFHETLYANQLGENVGSFTPARLKQIAQVVGLDMNAFNQCLDSHKHQGDVQAMTKQGSSQGVQATPSFSVNNGAPFTISSYDDLKKALDKALGAQS